MRARRWAVRLLSVLCVLCALSGCRAESYVRAVLTDGELSLRSGPGNGYELLGSYPAGGQEIALFSRAWDAQNGIWWVQAEYSEGGKRLRGYTEAWRFGSLDPSCLRTETALGTCMTPGYSQDGYCGPGYDYRRVKVPADTQCLICDSVNDFLQLEFYDTSAGRSRRVWLLEPFGADGGSGY